MHEPYQVRFSDRPAGELPVLTGTAERCYAANTSVRFAAGGDYRLLVTLQGGSPENNACLLRPGRTVLYSFSEYTRLCDICFQGGSVERFFSLPKLPKPSSFTVAQPQQLACFALDAVQVPEGCHAALYRSAQLVRVFSCFPFDEEERGTDNCGKRAMQYIRENYMRPINVNDVACAVGVSRSWLYRCFMDYAEQSPAMYLRDLRLERAKSLLVRTGLTVQEIASAVGYEDPLYFSRVFSEYIGCAPSAYRKRFA